MKKTSGRKTEIKGIVVPMVTSFMGPYGSVVDTDSLARLTDYLIENRVHGLMPLGTSGEFALMSREERKQVISAVAKATKGRVPVIAGVSTPGTKDAIHLAEDAEKAGADVIISTGPYYYKTNSEGLYNHFQKVIDSSNLPFMVYNIPSWAGYNVPAAVVRRLVDRNPGRVLGVKFTTNDLAEFLEYLRLLKNDISIMIGSDPLILPALEMGAAGAVVGSANVLPDLTSSIYESYASGDLEQAKKLQDRLDPFTETMILGSYPAGLKAALKLIQVDCGPVRLPLLDLKKSDVEKVRRSIAWKIREMKLGR